MAQEATTCPQDAPETGPDSHTRDSRFRSPSGLLTQMVWERDLQRSGQPPSAADLSDGERNRQFARWVQIEAKTLASQLEQLVRPDLKRGLSRHVRAVAAALAGDAEWARQRIDGR